MVKGVASKFDAQIWVYQNLMRTRPKAFLPYLNEMKANYSGSIYTRPDGMRLSTREGVRPVDELIQVLTN
jgi:hypothetical protein